jgi:hypothetical protein
MPRNPDTHPDQGPVEPRPDDASAVPGSTPVQTSLVRPNRPKTNIWGTGRMLILLLKLFVVTYLSVVDMMHVAPAVRVGYSWASNNLRLIQSYITMCCLVLVCANLLLGQAQLVVRGVRALCRLWPTHRYPATCKTSDA